MAEDKVLVTQEGYEKLQKKLDYLISVKRREVAERLKTARELGDLSENSEYDDAKNEQAFVEGEIRETEAKIKRAEIIQIEGDNDVVRLGSKVKIQIVKSTKYVLNKETNKEEAIVEEISEEAEDYEIVGTTEADPLENKISNESPLGKAILGQSVGSAVIVVGPDKVEYEYKILDIKF